MAFATILGPSNMNNDNLNELYYDMIYEENLISYVRDRVSKVINDPKIEKIREFSDIIKKAFKGNASKAAEFLKDLRNLNITNEDGESEESMEASVEKTSRFMRFIKKYEFIFRFIIPFYDGLITEDELKVLPEAIKAMVKGEWGLSLSNAPGLAKASNHLKKSSVKAYQRIVKHGSKQGGKVMLRLSKRQMCKLAKKITWKPMQTLLLKLCAKLAVVTSGAAAVGGSAATVAGIPMSIVIAIATALYYIYVVLDTLSAVNDILRLVAQVYIEDQKHTAELNNDDIKEDPKITQAIEDGSILDMAAD